MPLRRVLPLVLVLLSAPSAGAETYSDRGVTAEVTPERVTLANALVSRTWTRAAFASTLVDRRGRDHTWSSGQPDFTLAVAGQDVSSADFAADAVTVTPLPRGGLRVVFRLRHAVLALTATRTVEVYPGVAGFRTQMTVASPVPLMLSSFTLDEIAAGGSVTPTIHAFRAGADWRGESNWQGPEFGSIGDAHAGDWRDTRSGLAGEPLAAPGEWISAVTGDRSAFQVLERNDFPSSRARYDGKVATTRVDFTRDILSLGPLEETGHVENPREEEAGRGRLITRDGLALPAAFTGVARGDGDEEWQFHKYLVEHRIDPYPRDVVFNSDATDRNEISTGAKDDMDMAAVRESAPVARALGADVFTLDDGWQAASGDWQPDSPDHRDPRVGDPTYQGDKTKLAPRFPDAEFAAVREAIAPMKLGLWMSPLSYHPRSEVYRAHPEWGCTPTGQATGASGLAQPDSGSNEAGLGQWNTNYLPFLEERLREAIVEWQVKLFKFDFLVWLDCPGVNDLYEAHDRFLALIDKLRAEFPDVAFAVDETNDYRLFPFESTLRGPTWFTNGGPTVAQILHNTWNLSPWIPAFALGQKVLTGSQRDQPVATSVASTLLNEPMITQDVRPSRDPYFSAIAPEARTWFDWGKARRAEYLSGVTYPLLADPLGGKQWTALQNWNPDTRRGALLAFRQDDERGSVPIALRNVPDGSYEVRSAPDDALVGTFTAAQLREGLTVTAPPRGAKVLTITGTP